MQLLESQERSHLMLSLKLTLVMLVFIGGGVEHCLVKCFIGRGCLSHWPANVLGKVVSPILCQLPDMLFSDVLNLFFILYVSAGRKKIPTIVYPEGSQFARRLKYIAWRAAVEMAQNVSQLILQVISSLSWKVINKIGH
jgi:hypothetical protein